MSTIVESRNLIEFRRLIEVLNDMMPTIYTDDPAKFDERFILHGSKLYDNLYECYKTLNQDEKNTIGKFFPDSFYIHLSSQLRLLRESGKLPPHRFLVHDMGYATKILLHNDYYKIRLSSEEVERRRNRALSVPLHDLARERQQQLERQQERARELDMFFKSPEGLEQTRIQEEKFERQMEEDRASEERKEQPKRKIEIILAEALAQQAESENLIELRRLIQVLNDMMPSIYTEDPNINSERFILHAINLYDNLTYYYSILNEHEKLKIGRFRPSQLGIYLKSKMASLHPPRLLITDMTMMRTGLRSGEEHYIPIPPEEVERRRNSALAYPLRDIQREHGLFNKGMSTTPGGHAMPTNPAIHVNLEQKFVDMTKRYVIASLDEPNESQKKIRINYFKNSVSAYITEYNKLSDTDKQKAKKIPQEMLAFITSNNLDIEIPAEWQQTTSLKKYLKYKQKYLQLKKLKNM